MPAIAGMRRLVPFFPLCVCVRERERWSDVHYIHICSVIHAQLRAGKVENFKKITRTVNSQHIRHYPFRQKKKEKKG